MPSLKSLLAGAATLAVTVVKAQDDVILWHNRYHAVLAMAAYNPNYDQLCPAEEFTEENLRKNFPNSPYAPWEVLDRWGPTAHQGGGFTAMIPEMDKVVLVFTGDYWKLKNLPTETASLDVLGLAGECPGCRANAFALQGYLEAKEASNGFERGMQRWRDTGLWWSQTGHGLGGMLSLIAALDLGGSRNVSKFIHAYGNPRTFNPAAAAYYNRIYGGDMTEQGYGNADPFAHQIPASDEYAHINTGFYYYGWDDTYKMNHRVCYEGPEDPHCKPAAPYNELDHFYLFTNVGHCGRTHRQNQTVAAQYLASLGVDVHETQITAVPSSSLPASTDTLSSTALNATASIAQLGDTTSNATLLAGDATSTAASVPVSSATLALSRSSSATAAGAAGSSSATAGVRNAANADQANLSAATGTGSAGRLTAPVAAIVTVAAAFVSLF